MTYSVKMDKFKVAEDLKDLIENRSLFKVVEHDKDEGSLMIQIGKKKFVIQVQEI
jgi:hypothetical protein